ncbi:MAG: type II toxin-antitoxin system VapC family toxin [Anaerolineae bacterium]
MYLVDANVFLDVLLAQERKEVCKKFLDDNIENLYISDFSLHSIGVILFRNNKEDIFHKFIEDILFNIEVITLGREAYKELATLKKTLGLDFDDVYQYMVAQGYGLEIATMDRDFEKVKERINVLFIQDSV